MADIGDVRGRIDVLLDGLADDIQARDREVERLLDEVGVRVEAAEARAAVAERARSEAERHEGMFRRALFTYLQERDGPAGRGAPTPETLELIRKLVDDS